MRPQTRNKKLIRIPIALVIAGLALALAVPVLAAYLGPNRTVTRTFPQYNIVQKSNNALLCVVYSPPPSSIPVSGACNEFSVDPNYPCTCGDMAFSK
ncbi:MAG: hypothetical protein FJZ96_10355 [Chloroflexi bacterium]|nr:hypothetical protein [Chloroflexota bacterium]